METRSQRVQRMLQKRRPTLKRQYGKRNLFNTNENRTRNSTGLNERNNQLRNYLAETANESNDGMNSPFEPNYGYSSSFTEQEKRNLNAYLKNLENRNKAKEAYRQRRTLSGSYNRFRNRLRNPNFTRKFRFPRRKSQEKKPINVYYNLI